MASKIRMLLLCAMGAAALMCAGPASARGFFDGLFGPEDDKGGRLAEYAARVYAANRNRQLIRIDYVCESACTMKLGARYVCATSDAVFRFHSASYGAGTGIKAPEGNRAFMRSYPPRIRAWVRQHRALDSFAYTSMSGEQAIALGIRRCPD